MNTEQKVELPVFLQKIIEVAQSGDFGDGDIGHPVGEGENVVFEMTPFERACLSFRKVSDQAREMFARGAPIESEEIQDLIRQANIAEKLLVASLRERFPKDRGVVIGIRDGWKVVNESGSGCDGNCSACSMVMGQMADAIPGMHIIDLTRGGSMMGLGMHVIEIDLTQGGKAGLLNRIFGRRRPF